MNITQVNFSIGKTYGGAPLIVSTLAKGLLERGHKINLICNRIDDHYLENDQNVKVIHLHAGFLKSLKSINDCLTKLNTDIIHIHIIDNNHSFI